MIRKIHSNKCMNKCRESGLLQPTNQANISGFLHVVIISAKDIPDRSGYFSNYKDAKVYVALNFRGQRKSTKAISQMKQSEPTEWGEELIWTIDKNSSVEQELIAVEVLWESTLRDQQIGAVAVPVPSAKGVVQQKEWQLQTSTAQRPAAVLLKTWLSDSEASDAQELRSLEMREISDPVTESLSDVLLDNISLGVYKVNVEVLEARGLPARPSGGICSPFVCIQVDGGKRFCSAIVSQAGEHAAWFESFSFNLDIKDPLDIRRAKLHIGCWDAGRFANDLIGTFDIELGVIYSQSGHEMFRKWATLFNFQDENKGGIQGLLLLSVSVLGPEDKATVHNDNDLMPRNGDKSEGDFGILISPSVERKSYLVELRIYRAVGLPQMDFTVASALGGQGIDAYVRLKFGGDAFSSKSSIVKSRNPSFNEAIYCPVILPSYSDTIEVNIMDHDYFDADDFIGTLFFSFHDLLKHGERYSQPQWWNIYGAPQCSDSWPAMAGPGGRMERSASAMNKGERVGSSWRGRILMSLNATSCPMKELKFRSLPCPLLPLRREADVKNAEPEMACFLMAFKLFLACNIASNNKLNIEVRIGETTICKSSEHVAVDGTVSWWEIMYGKFYVPLEYSSPASDRRSIAWQSCPDVFIDLRDQKGRVGFVRVDLRACHSKSEAKWHDVLPDEFDRCGPDSGFQGMLLFEARSGVESEMSPTLDIGVRNIPLPPKVSYRLVGYVYLAENLRAADSSINPFVAVSCCGQGWKSKTVRGSQYPAWYEPFSVDFMSFQQKEFIPPMMIQVWNENKLMRNDVLGFTTIPAHPFFRSSSSDDGETVPLWYELYHPDTSPINRTITAVVGSKILLALKLVEVRNETCKNCNANISGTAVSCPVCKSLLFTDINVSRRVLPIMKLCTVEIFVFALRDLMPCGVLPMASPFLSASLSSIKLSTRASDRPTATSPNFLQSIIFRDVLLPTDPDLAPAITVRASDRRFAGTVFLGSAPVHIAEYLPWISNEARKSARKARREREGDIPSQASAHQEISKISDVDLSIHPRCDESRPTLKMKLCIDGQIFSVDVEDDFQNSHDSGIGPYEYLKGRTVLETELEQVLLESEDNDPNSEESRISTYILKRHTTLFFSSEIVTYCAGRLKLLVHVTEKQNETPFKPIAASERFASVVSYAVRLYVLNAEGLASEDTNGSSDPYLRVSLGKQQISRREFAKNRCLNPVFHQRFEFQSELPGISILKIDVMDADMVTSDDLIGSTSIDLEERIMSKCWLAAGHQDDSVYPLKPLEIRRLYAPGSKQSRGTLKLWLDIFTTKEAQQFAPIDISIEPEPFMLRVVVWQVKGARNMDPITKQNDMYVLGRLLCADLDGKVSTSRKQTDTHWRCKNGEGSFNWRWNFPVTLPLKDMQLTLQAWDKDLIGSDDLIGETTLSLRNLVLNAARTDKSSHPIPLRFPSSVSIEKALKKTPDVFKKSKRDRRLACLIRRKISEGKSLESIASEMKKFEGVGSDESQVWTAQRVAALAEDGEPESGSWFSIMQSCFRSVLSCVTLASGNILSHSPNPTAWIPLLCENLPEIADLPPAWCCVLPTCTKSRFDVTDFSCNNISMENQSCSGWIEIEVELIPQKYFEEHMSGEGREEPNQHPKLPPPSRVKWSSLLYRPDLLAYEILGPEMCYRMVILAVIAALIVGLIHTLPLIITNIYTSSQIASKFPTSWVVVNKSS